MDTRYFFLIVRFVINNNPSIPLRSIIENFYFISKEKRQKNFHFNILFDRIYDLVQIDIPFESKVLLHPGLLTQPYTLSIKNFCFHVSIHKIKYLVGTNRINEKVSFDDKF